MRSQLHRWGLLIVCGLSLLITVVVGPLSAGDFPEVLKWNFALGFLDWLDNDYWNGWDKLSIVLRNIFNWATIAGVVFSLLRQRPAPTATPATSFAQAPQPFHAPMSTPPGIDRP